MAPPPTTANYYTLLSLPLPPHTPPLPPSLIKRAYHRALLLHHPDKAHPTNPSTAPRVSIDLLTLAYKTLSTSRLRAEYDLTLGKELGDGSVVQYTDLEEFVYWEEEGRWSLGCRCGEEEGFEVREEELEEEEEAGEVLVGCRGCSLWRRVGFAVVVE